MSALHSTLAQDALNLYFGVIAQVLEGVRRDLRSLGQTEEQVQVISSRLEQKWKQKLAESHCVDSYGGRSQAPLQVVTGSHYPLGSDAIPPPPTKRPRVSGTIAPSVFVPQLAEANDYVEGKGVPHSLDEIHNPYLHPSMLKSATASTLQPSAAAHAADGSHPYDSTVSGAVAIDSSTRPMAPMVSVSGSAIVTLDDASLIAASVNDCKAKPTVPRLKQELARSSSKIEEKGDCSVTSSAAIGSATDEASALASMTRTDVECGTALAVGFSDDEEDSDEERRESEGKRVADEKKAAEIAKPKFMFKGRDLNAPLNSDDDDSADYSESEIATDNVLICQFRSVDRKRSEWKAELVNGILHVDGKDFAFRTLVNGKFIWDQ